jgi:hypothetical protein
MNTRGVSTVRSSAKKGAAAVGFDKPATEIVPVPSHAGVGYLEGDWSAGDIKLPRLDLKHAVDTRFADVAPGHYAYSRSPEDYLSLVPPLEVIFLKAVKGYRQNVEPGEIPLVCHTRAELAELGGTTEKNRPDLTLFSPFCDTLLLIDQSAHSEWRDTPLVEVGETRKAALATYCIKGSAFAAIGSILAGQAAYQLLTKQKPALLWEQVWKLGSKLRQMPSFSYQEPTLARLNGVTPAEAQACKELAENL